MELRSDVVTSFILILRGEILPPGVELEGAVPTVIPVEGGAILDPGWKGLKLSNSFARRSGVTRKERWWAI